jgi:DNA-binding MarR family transcriptional regulator
MTSKEHLLSLFRIGISIHNMNKFSEKKFGLSLVQWCLLGELIDMPGASAWALSKAVGVHPSTLTQTLKRLEKKGYVFVDEHPQDSRKKLISITKKGKRTFEESTAEMKSWSQKLNAIGDSLKDVHQHLNHLE